MMHGFLFSLPHWFLVLLTGTLGMVPVAGRWRFGRLIVVSAFAFVMVLWALVVAIAR